MSNITGTVGFFVFPKALVMARLSVVASPFAMPPPSPSRFCPLVLYYHYPDPGGHPTAHHRLAHYCSPLAGIPCVQWLCSPFYSPRSSRSCSVTPTHGMALPPWLPPMPWSNDRITSAAVVYCSSVGQPSRGFQTKERSLSSPSSQRLVALANISFLPDSLPNGWALFTCPFL